MDPHIFEMLQSQWTVAETAGDPNALLASLGFRPVFLDCATMTMHLIRCDVREPTLLVRGYERNGYFYTRSAAARAAKEWARF